MNFDNIENYRQLSIFSIFSIMSKSFRYFDISIFHIEILIFCFRYFDIFDISILSKNIRFSIFSILQLSNCSRSSLSSLGTFLFPSIFFSSLVNKHLNTSIYYFFETRSLKTPAEPYLKIQSEIKKSQFSQFSM